MRVMIFASVLFLAAAALLLASCSRLDNSPPEPPQASDDLPRPGVCATHVLFWFPPLEQSLCGITTLEQVYTAVCEGGGGAWVFTPGSEAKCVGYQRPEPKEG